MSQFIAYYRVSTDRQGQSGLGLEAQRDTVSRYTQERGAVIAEFTEIETGKHAIRPELQAALKLCRQKRARLVIAKLDRLARNVHFISGLMESGVDFVACDIPEADRTTLQMMAVFGEHERRMISQRTKEALAVAKARGVRLGNPKPAAAVRLAVQATKKQADDFATTMKPLIERLQSEGLSLTGIARELNERGVKTARNRTWQAVTVRNILQRAA